MSKRGVLLNAVDNSIIAIVFTDLPAGECTYASQTSYDALLQHDLLVNARRGKLSFSKANLKKAFWCDRYASEFNAQRREFLLEESVDLDGF